MKALAGKMNMRQKLEIALSTNVAQSMKSAQITLLNESQKLRQMDGQLKNGGFTTHRFKDGFHFSQYFLTTDFLTAPPLILQWIHWTPSLPMEADCFRNRCQFIKDPQAWREHGYRVDSAKGIETHKPPQLRGLWGSPPFAVGWCSMFVGSEGIKHLH